MAKSKKQKINIKHFKIGTQVKSYLRNSSGKKIEVIGVVKDVTAGWGYVTYTLGECTTGDFITRIAKKLKVK